MHVQRQIDELLAYRASEWLDLLPAATEEQRAAFATWLGESKLHVQAFVEVAEVEYGLRHIDKERRVDVEALISQVASNVVPLGRPPPRLLAPRSSLPKRRTWRTTITAGHRATSCSAITSWEEQSKSD